MSLNSALCLPHVRMKLQKLTDLGYKTLPYSPNKRLGEYGLPLFLVKFLGQKAFCYKEDAEIAFKDLLASKPLEFYHIGINLAMAEMYRCSGFLF